MVTRRATDAAAPLRRFGDVSDPDPGNVPAGSPMKTNRRRYFDRMVQFHAVSPA